MATDYWRRSATEKQRRDTKMWKDDLKNFLIISKEGVPVDKLNEMLDNDGVGQIPFAKLGFQHLNHFLFECEDFLQLGRYYATEQLFLFVKQNKVPSALDSLAQLVKGQERSKGTAKNPRPLRHQISNWLPIYDILRHSVRNDNARDYQPPPKHFPRRRNNNRGRSSNNNVFKTQSRPNYSRQSNFNQFKKFSFNNDSGSDGEDELAKWEFCSSFAPKKENEENDWGPEPNFYDTVDNAQQKATSSRTLNNATTIQPPKPAINYSTEKNHIPIPQKATSSRTLNNTTTIQPPKPAISYPTEKTYIPISQKAASSRTLNNTTTIQPPRPAISYPTEKTYIPLPQKATSSGTLNNTSTIQPPQSTISYPTEKTLPQNTSSVIPSLSMVLERLNIQPDSTKRNQELNSTNKQSILNHSNLPNTGYKVHNGKIRSFVQPPQDDAPPAKTCISCTVMEMSRSTKDYKFMVLDNSKIQQLREIEKEMGSLYEEDENYKIPQGYLQPGCYGVFIPEWEKWVRCHIRMTIKPGVEQFPARLIDYAVFKVVARQNMRYMTNDFYDFPPQSYRAKLDPPCEEKLQQLEDYIMSQTMTFFVTDVIYHAPSEITILTLKVANSRKWDQLCSPANRKNGEN